MLYQRRHSAHFRRQREHEIELYGLCSFKDVFYLLELHLLWILYQSKCNDWHVPYSTLFFSSNVKLKLFFPHVKLLISIFISSSLCLVQSKASVHNSKYNSVSCFVERAIDLTELSNCYHMFKIRYKNPCQSQYNNNISYASPTAMSNRINKGLTCKRRQKIQ